MNRLHPLSALALAFNRGVVGFLLPFVLVSAAAGFVEFVNPGWAFVLGLVGFAVGTAYGAAYYSRFTYELTDDTFDIASGVVSRRSREIPYRRIQNVDVRQGLVFTVLGLAVVTVETAGGGDAEATLNFVSEDEAKRLQQDIRRLTAASAADRETKRRSREAATNRVESTDEIGPSEAPPAPGDVDGGAERTPIGPERPPAHTPTKLFTLTARELLIYSFASFRPAALAAVGFLVFFASEVVIEYLLAVAQPVGGPEGIEAGTTRSYLVLSVVSMVHGVLITYALSVLYTFFTYYGFRLGRAGDDLVYERGLLQRYSGSIPVEKVQSVTVTDNPIQRRIDYAGLWVETAGYGPDSNGGSQSAVPLARVPRVHRFAERLTDVEPPSFERPTRIARRRYVVRYAILATAVVAVAFVVTVVTPLESWYLAAALYLLVPPAAHLRWRHLGYYVGEENLVIRAGFWRRRTTVIPYYRLQTVSTRRSIFQRRLGLASLVVDTASSRTFFWSTPTIHDVDLAVAREIHAASRDRLQVALEDRSDGGSVRP